MTKLRIDTICNDGDNASYFSYTEIELTGSLDRMLSAQQTAENYRLRTSQAGYLSDWHVAGDPTLLIILTGVVEIEMRDGTARHYSAGDLFIAKDYLKSDKQYHEMIGHRARVVGDESMTALHLKLKYLNDTRTS